jgi:hypothetical protein
MANSRTALNDRQLAVLRWIGDGCPDGVMTGTIHKTSAGALSSRRLVVVSRRRGHWHAELTERGRYYLEHGAYPPAPPDAEMPAAGRPGRATPQASAASGANEHPAPDTPRASGPRLSPSEELVAAVQAAGGKLPIKREWRPGGPDYSQLVWAANRFNKTPPGTELVIHYSDRGEREIRLVAAPEAPETPDLAPVPVPEQLRKPHAIVVALRSDLKDAGWTRAIAPRALRIVQAIITEAERRGYRAGPPRRETSPYRLRGTDAKAQFAITIDDLSVGMWLAQETDRQVHVPTAKELAEKARSSWTRIPTHDSIPSDRLRLELTGSVGQQQSRWGDRKSWTLEEKLPEVFQELALRGAAHRQKVIDERLAAEARKRRWEAAMARAKADLIEAHRRGVLDKQLDAWLRAEQMRRYLAAMREIVVAMTDSPEQAAASEWLAWAEEHTSRADPLLRTLAMPPDPEPKPDALQPFLKGWSVYGPECFYGYGR